MNRLYWVAWLLGSVAFWLTVGWFGVSAIVIDPYFDRQVDRVIATAAPGAPSKDDMQGIESARSSAFKAVGVLGGTLSGFAFGVAACYFRRRSNRGDAPEAAKD